MKVTKQLIIDAIIARATYKWFSGDQRDGDTPPITIENFVNEIFRLGAKALRVRLSRLSRAELLAELSNAAAYVTKHEKQLHEIIALAERTERENDAQALRQRQAELARRPRLQRAILAAAAHYRQREMNAKEAWRAIKQKPFAADGETVVMQATKKQKSCAYARAMERQ
jgi:hypothetical protein